MRTLKLPLLFLGVAIGQGLILPRPAAAQFLSTAWRALNRIPDPRFLPGEIVSERFSERRLQRDQVRLQEDLGRGDAASVNRDLRRLQHDEVRTEHLRWEIQRDSLHLHIGPDPLYAQRGGTAAGLVAHPQYPGYGYLPADPTLPQPQPQPPPLPPRPLPRRRCRSRLPTPGRPGRASTSSSTASLTRRRAASRCNSTSLPQPK